MLQGMPDNVIADWGDDIYFVVWDSAMASRDVYNYLGDCVEGCLRMVPPFGIDCRGFKLENMLVKH